MNCLLVLAHPVQGSLTHALADHARTVLQARGHIVTTRDLCAEGFDPVLTPAERGRYYETGPTAIPALPDHAAELREAEGLILVFPVWWFGMPAVLKGWFDRVWAPGTAFDHSAGGTGMRARLTGLSRVTAIATLGGPWWADRLILRQPVARALRYGTVMTCAPGARFSMLSLHDAARVSPQRFAIFADRIERSLSRW